MKKIEPEHHGIFYYLEMAIIVPIAFLFVMIDEVKDLVRGALQWI